VQGKDVRKIITWEVSIVILLAVMTSGTAGMATRVGASSAAAAGTDFMATGAY